MPSTTPINQPGVPIGSNINYPDGFKGPGSEPSPSADPSPGMKTFIYTPKVRVVIARGNRQIDVSRDIVRCSLHRAESSAASFFMTLANKNWKYTPKEGPPVFHRMDRIVVYMGRTTPIQVFSGYLDTVPYKQAYPGTVDFKATCTIKRLMHTRWNPALEKSQQLLDQRTAAQAQAGDRQGGLDTGLGSMLRRLLVMVGGWRTETIHIQNFPDIFFRFLAQQLEKQKKENKKAVEAFTQMLLGSDQSPAPGAAAGYNPNAGTPGPMSGVGAAPGAGVVGGSTAFYVTQIIQACDDRGMGPLVTDNNWGAGISQSGETLAGSRDDATKKAGEQMSSLGLSQQQANRESDAAILGVACASVETGPGVIRNYYNVRAPGSQECVPNDGPSHDGSSCGIFQQQNFAEWGTVQQRMNPKQAAGMFFDHLARMVPNWRNMEPGSAIQAVQRSAFPDRYSAQIPWATIQVKAARTAKGVTSGATLGTSAGSLLGAAPSASSNLVPGVPSLSPGSLAAGSRVGKPVPDSEGAINWALTQLGKPYIWGAEGPAGYDCSGLTMMAFRSIGVSTGGHYTGLQISSGQPVVPTTAAQRGDLVFPDGEQHVVMWLGDGTIIHAPQRGDVVKRVPAYFTLASASYVRRFAENGGPDPTAPFKPPESMGPGNPVGAMDTQGGTGAPGSAGGGNEPIARNLFAYMFTPKFSSDLADMLPGEKAFLDTQPLLQIITAVCGAGLRKWQSAPNGDFMAYYPDYFGIDQKPAVLRLEDIELKDFRIQYSDDPLTTHVYIEGNLTKIGQNNEALGWLDTAGVATVEDDWLYQRLIKVAPGDLENASGEQIMRRFGVRPLKQVFAMAGSYELELLLACQVFMEKWAQQYQTTISMTFMPELFPGMRVYLPNHNLTVYVTEVTHTCDMVGGFSTTAVICAPARPNVLSAMSEVSTPGETITDAINGGPGQAFNNPTGLGSFGTQELGDRIVSSGG